MLVVIVKEKTIYPMKFSDIRWRSDSRLSPQLIYINGLTLCVQRPLGEGRTPFNEHLQGLPDGKHLSPSNLLHGHRNVGLPSG